MQAGEHVRPCQSPYQHAFEQMKEGFSWTTVAQSNDERANAAADIFAATLGVVAICEDVHDTCRVPSA